MTQTSAPISTSARTQATPDLYNKVVADIADLHTPTWHEIPATETWTYVSTSGGYIMSNSPAKKYPIGTKFRLKQGGGFKYGVLVDTRPDGSMLAGLNDAYPIVAGAITNVAVSYESGPSGWPAHFEYTSVAYGFTTSPVTKIRYSVEGSQVIMQIDVAQAVSNQVYCYVDTPFAAKVLGGELVIGVAEITNNSAKATTPGIVYFDCNGTDDIQNIRFSKDFGKTDNWTNSGNKAIHSSTISFVLKEVWP